MHRFPMPQYKVPIGGEWTLFSEVDLAKMMQDDPDRYENIDYLLGEYQRNPLAFFLPHGAKREDGTNDGIACMNDYEHDLVLVTAGNQQGKSTLGAAYLASRIVPTDPSWPCFTHHGLKHQPWTGPKIAIIASYSWDEVNTVWNVYKNFLPRHELREYAPFYGQFPGEDGKAKDLRFHHAAKRITLACGSVLIFLCYRQSLTHWTGKQCDIAHLDEQCPEDKFDELTQRQLTRGSFTPIIMTLTGHVIPDRPDTGAAGWIKTKVVDKGITKGRSLAQYKLTIDTTPDVIISADAKQKAYIQWVEEPRASKDEKKQREAEARYFGGWEIGGGLAFPEWNPYVHMIEPFNLRKYMPTYYRMIDHGINPCAAVLFAVMPWGDIIACKEYYEYGKYVAENARGIVEKMCGNSRRLIDGTEEEQNRTYEEEYTHIQIRSSELDSRSFNAKTPDQGLLIGHLYNKAGCFCSPACGKKDDTLFALLRDALSVDPERMHIDVRLGRCESMPFKGAPKIYVFRNLMNTKNELETFTGGKNQADHLISCLKFLVAYERPYLGDYYHATQEAVQDNTVSAITGY